MHPSLIFTSKFDNMAGVTTTVSSPAPPITEGIISDDDDVDDDAGMAGNVIDLALPTR